MSALQSLIGGPEDPIACKDVQGMTVHWWLGGAAPGDPCLCGAKTLPEPIELVEDDDG